MNSVVIKSVDRSLIRQAVEAYAARLRREHPEIVRIIWFGSWVNGQPSPGSDVDLCLILSASDRHPRDRISDYLPLGFPVGVDLAIYTREEFEALQRSSPAWRQVISTGEEL